ncbi:MAG: hypothetical protein CL555_18655 [Algoriphagus sp.]|nr:hypothetical protein [Algoriphagus sp.]
MAQVEEPSVGFLDHGPVDAGKTILVDLGGELAGLLDLPNGTEFQRRQLAGPFADTMNDVVAVDDQILPQIVLAPDDDMHMGMAGVVVIDRHPIELGAEVGFHPAHEVAGIGRKVRQLRAVVGRDDEPELVAVILAAFQEGVAIRAVLGARIKLAALAVARGAVALDIAQMGVRLPALSRVKDVALLNHDATRARLPMMPAAAEIAGADEDRAAPALHALAARQDRMRTGRGCGCERRRFETASGRGAALLPGDLLRLREEALGLARAWGVRADAAGPWPEAVFVIGAHGCASGRNRGKSGNRRPWCRTKACKARALHGIAALRRSRSWCRKRRPNQCADNNNFGNRPDMVPVPSILPSLLIALSVLPTGIPARRKPA